MRYKDIAKYTATLACFVVSLFLVVACEEEVSTLQGFQLSSDKLMFDAEGGVELLSIQSGEEWTAETNSDWCIITPANGFGSVECKIHVDTSYLFDAREAFVTFYVGSKTQQLSVSQLGFKKEIVVDEELFSIPDYQEANKAFFDVQVLSNIDFEVSIPENVDWLSVEKEKVQIGSVPRNQKLKFKYKTNTSFKNRIANITLKPLSEDDATALPEVFQIEQAAAQEIIPSRAGDSLAVLMMCRMLNTIMPDVSKPIINWDNVQLEEFPVENGLENETEYRVTGLQIAMIETNETIPYVVKYLTKIKVLSIRSNSNSYIKRIDLADDITNLTELETLDIFGYGISSLPQSLTRLKKLKNLYLDANTLNKIPVEIIKELPNLEQLSMSNNRFGSDVFELNTVEKDSYLGLRGSIPRELLMLDNLNYINLSYNYLEGSIPDVPVGSMPNLHYFSLNLNFLSGQLPQWILEHPNLGCWNPIVLLFNQTYGKNSSGFVPGFTNAPVIVPDCPL